MKKISEIYAKQYSSDESETEMLSKYSINKPKNEKSSSNFIKCFLRIRPLDSKDSKKIKNSKVKFFFKKEIMLYNK